MQQHGSPMRQGRQCTHAALSAAAHVLPGSASCTALQTLRQNFDDCSDTEGSGGFQHRTTCATPQWLSQQGAIVPFASYDERKHHTIDNAIAMQRSDGKQQAHVCFLHRHVALSCDQDAEQGKQGGLLQKLAASLLKGVSAAATFAAACLLLCNRGSHASEVAKHGSLLSWLLHRQRRGWSGARRPA